MSVLVASGAVVAVAMILAWLASLRLRNAAIIDAFWVHGFVLVALGAFTVGDGCTPRRALVLGLAAMWGLRLGAHLASRNLGKPEDFPYARMRERAGERFGRESLVRVFAVQAVAMWTVSLPPKFAQISGTTERLTGGTCSAGRLGGVA